MKILNMKETVTIDTELLLTLSGLVVLLLNTASFTKVDADTLNKIQERIEKYMDEV